MKPVDEFIRQRRQPVPVFSSRVQLHLRRLEELANEVRAARGDGMELSFGGCVDAALLEWSRSILGPKVAKEVGALYLTSGWDLSDAALQERITQLELRITTEATKRGQARIKRQQANARGRP